MDFISYEPITPSPFISVQAIYTLHYFEYMSHLAFPGESHDFWEFIYVDQGQVLIEDVHTEYLLNEGDIFFHYPNHFHNVKILEHTAPNLIVISFASYSKAMYFFGEKLLSLTDVEKKLLANIISIAKTTYSNNLADPYYTKLNILSTALPDSEHLIKLYLELFLIYIYRRYNYQMTSPDVISDSCSDYKIYTQIHAYLTQNIRKQVTLNHLSSDLLIAPPKLQKIIKKYHNCTIIEYFSSLKIAYAKQLIRTNTLTLSQIADYLGYSSIHYFSRQFKLMTGMPPSRYAHSVKALMEHQLSETPSMVPAIFN